MANITVPLREKAREKVVNRGRRGKRVKEFTQLPAIILLDKGHHGSDHAKKCALESRFKTWEAANIFEALEGISDFTQQNRPDIVFVEVDSLKSDLQLVIEMLSGAGSELEFPLFTLSALDDCVDSSDPFEEDFNQIAAILDEVILKIGAEKNATSINSLSKRAEGKSVAFQTCLKEIRKIQKRLKATHDEIELLKRKTRVILTNI